MKIHNILSIVSGVYKVTRPVFSNSAKRITESLNNKLVSENYVTREEFVREQQILLKLQQKLDSELKNRDKKLIGD